MMTAEAYEASKQNGPRNEPQDGARNDTRGKQAADTVRRPEIVFSSPQVGKETRGRAAAAV